MRHRANPDKLSGFGQKGTWNMNSQKSNQPQETGNTLITGNDLPEIRRIWYNNEWHYAIVDFIKIWTESTNPYDYWHKMKLRADPDLKQFITTHLVSFPMKATDGRRRQTETANRETLLRIVQSVPSKNAEKIKLWLAEVGNQRLEEIEQTSSEIDQLRATYRKKGYDEIWIEARIADLLARNELTTLWQDRGAQNSHYPMLTNILVERTFGFTIKSYKVYKEISQSANLPDNMTPEELAFNILSKTTAKTYHETRESHGINALHQDVIDAGDTTRAARELIEERTGVLIVSKKNAKNLRKIPSKKRMQLSSQEMTRFDQ
jgi:hypothetical protein